MGRRTDRPPIAALAAVLLAVLSACSTASASRDASPDPVRPRGSSTTASTTTTVPPTTTTTAAPPPPADRPTTDGHGFPLAEAGGVVVVHPSARIEHVGFHQSSVLGAQELTVLPTAVGASTLNTRNRGTGDRTAVDVVVQPDTVVLAPVNGRVVTAGPYRLYCRYDDETVVIEPEAHPGWRVVLFHVQGVRVAAGQVVEAGLTPVADRAHQLPFRSQVDRLATRTPAWPHVHVEIDDSAIADTPSKGDSCPAG